MRGKAPYSNVRRAEGRCGAIDTHELMKQEIYAQDASRDTNYVFQTQASTPVGEYVDSAPAAVAANTGFEDISIYFDSLAKNVATTDLSNGTIGWSIITINNNQDIRNIISLGIRDFFFQRIKGPANSPDFFFYKRLYMQCPQLPAQQSIIGSGNVQFHWELVVSELNSLAVQVSPLRQTYYLPRPLINLPDIQFRFFVPAMTTAGAGMRPVPLVNESYQVQVIPGSTPNIQFRVIDTNILTPNNGGTILNVYQPPQALGSVPAAIPAPGIAIQMFGFTPNPAGPVNQAVAQQVNEPAGVYITNIVLAPAVLPNAQYYYFEIAGIDGATVTGAAPNRMTVMQARIAFPVYFTCLRNTLTNHVRITHE